MKSVVEVSSLHKSFESGGRSRQLLNSVSFSLLQGEFVALTGRSGSGKTTLVNILSGIDTADSGEVLIRGTALHSMTENERASFRLANVGLVFQFFHLLPTLSLRENILLPARFAKTGAAETQKRFSRLVEATGLESVVDQYPHQVSGGEAQRAAIARAIINHPPLLLADEPTGNLDIDTAESTIALLKQLQQEFPLTILMVTHEQSVAQIADRTLHLSRGALLS